MTKEVVYKIQEILDEICGLDFDKYDDQDLFNKIRSIIIDFEDELREEISKEIYTVCLNINPGFEK